MASKASRNEEPAYKKFEQDRETGNLRNLLFFYGREQYLIQWAVAALMKDNVQEAAKDLDFTKFDAKSFSLDALIQACETLPLLSSKRVVLVDDAGLFGSDKRGLSEQEEEQLTQYVATISSTCLLIVTATAVDKRKKLFKAMQAAGSCYEFGLLEEVSLKQFIEKRLMKAGLHAKTEAINEIIERSGYFDKESDYTLYHLENDLVKVIALAEGKELAKQDIVLGISGNEEAYLFDLLDALSRREKDEAYSLLNRLLGSGTNVYQLVAVLCSHLETALLVKEMKEEGIPLGSIKDQLGIHEFRIKKAAAVADRYTIPHLRKGFRQALEIDQTIKSGLMDARLALELLIASI